MKIQQKNRTTIAAAASAALAIALGVFGQAASVMADTYPSRPIRLVVPFPPGGNVDIVGRLIGKELTDALGKTVVVDNKPGASGNIGANAVAKAAPDGYTLLVGTVGTNVINPYLFKEIPFDPQKDFEPITLLASAPNVLVVSAESPIKSIAELNKLVKSSKTPISFATPGVGTTLHLSGEMYRNATQGNLLHVPYKGVSQALTDLIGGQVQLMFDNAPSILPHIQGGKVRPLAVTSAKRLPSFPNVPTMEESGIPGLVTSTWFGVYAPAGTPKDIVTKLNTALINALKKPEMKAKLTAMAFEPNEKATSEFKAFQSAERARWEPVLHKAGIKPE